MGKESFWSDINIKPQIKNEILKETGLKREKLTTILQKYIENPQYFFEKIEERIIYFDSSELNNSIKKSFDRFSYFVEYINFVKKGEKIKDKELEEYYNNAEVKEFYKKEEKEMMKYYDLYYRVVPKIITIILKNINSKKDFFQKSKDENAQMIKKETQDEIKNLVKNEIYQILSPMDKKIFELFLKINGDDYDKYFDILLQIIIGSIIKKLDSDIENLLYFSIKIEED